MFSLSIFLPAFISFILTIILCPVFIPVLHKMKFGQFVREEGPESHLKKAGTSNRETGLVPAFLFMGWRTNGM